MIDFWQMMAKASGLDLHVQLIGRDQLTPAVLRGDVQIFGALGALKDRERDFILGPTVVEVYSHIFVHRDLLQVNTLVQLEPFIVGVPALSSHIKVMQQLIPNVVRKEYDDINSMYDAAIRGEIKAFVALDRLNSRYKNYKSLNELYPLYKKVLLQKVAMTYAVTKANTALDLKLSQAFEQIRGEPLEKLQRRWLSGVNDDNTLLIGLSIGNQPLMTMSPTGQPQGVLVDLWDLWSAKTGVPISIVPDSTPDSLKALQQGRIDAHMGFPVGNHVPAETQAARSIYQVASSFYFPKKQTIKRLEDTVLPVGILRSAAYGEKLQQDYPMLQLRVFEKLDDMIQALERSDISGFFISDLIMDYRVLQQQRGAYQRLTLPRYTTDLHVLVGKNRSQVASQIVAGFNSMSQDELERIEDRWIDHEVGYFKGFRQRVPVSEEQSKWLAAHPVLRVGVMSNWAPLEFVDDNGKVIGMTNDVLKLLGDRLGVQFEPVAYERFDLMLADLKLRKLDVMANTGQTPEREQFALFSEPFWPQPYALLSRNPQQVLRVGQLGEVRLAIPSDYRLKETVERLLPEGQVIGTDSSEQSFQMLVAGQVDYLLDTSILAGRMIRRTEATGFRFHLPNDLPAEPMQFALRNDYQELQQLLNLALRTLTEQDKTDIYNTWTTATISVNVTDERLISITLQVLAVAVILVVLVIFWNMSLRREISLRKSMELKMRFMATHDDLTQLANRSLMMDRLHQAVLQHSRHQEKLALMFIDLDGFKDINDQHGHDVGDELLVKVAAILQHCVRKSDTVARFGGDEFVILLTGLMDQDDAAIVAEKIIQMLQDPLQLSVCQAQVGASIGIAMYPDNGVDATEILKAADGLMYRAKELGKGQYCFSKQEP